MKLKLNKPFASNSAVDENDVRQVKSALNYLGDYPDPGEEDNCRCRAQIIPEEKRDKCEELRRK